MTLPEAGGAADSPACWPRVSGEKTTTTSAIPNAVARTILRHYQKPCDRRVAARLLRVVLADLVVEKGMDRVERLAVRGGDAHEPAGRAFLVRIRDVALALPHHRHAGRLLAVRQERLAEIAGR